MYVPFDAAYGEGVETAETSADTLLIAAIRTALRAAADPARAEPMRRYMKSDMPFLGVVTGAWWDHVDDLAIHSVGPVLRAGHDAVAPLIDEWSRHPDRWLRRAAVICQVGAKADTDVVLLAACILANADDSDFFLRKGIGWALRQHARVDPDWVRAFVDQHADRLSSLSRREALRHLSPTRFPSPVTDE